nr:putative membrane protein [Quercus suber]
MGDEHPSKLRVAPTLPASSSIQHHPILPLHEATLHSAPFQPPRPETGHELDSLSPASETYCLSSSDSDQDPISFDASQHHPQMPPKKSKSRSPHPRGRHSTSGSLSSSNSIKDMNGAFRERAKHSSSLDVPEDSSVQTARLMNQSSFTLDEAPPMMPAKGGETGKSFLELPEQDRRNFLLLVLLYFLQGIPMGLAGGSVPFLLKSHMSYGQIGVYSLASYPYSLKLLWSPIVDAIWSSRLGRRKSWILPIQTLSGLGMIWLGTRAEAMMVKAGENDGAGIWGFTGWWFALVFMCATQDIAVDGWAITLISPSNLSYASTAQTVGLTAGHFLSYTVFLALSSPDFANKYFRTIPLEQGLLTLNSYLTLWGWVYLFVTLGLAVLKREDKTKERESLWDVYKIMGGILKLRNIQIFIIIHLIAKIGFQANDAVTNLKLLDKGFSQEDLALTVLIDFPFEISLGYYAGKWSEQYQPIRVWCWAFIGRLGAAIFAQLVVMSFPAGGTTTFYLCVVIIEHVYSTFMHTVMFVAISAFHAKIADPAIGGTYMTLLATVLLRQYPLRHLRRRHIRDFYPACSFTLAESPHDRMAAARKLSDFLEDRKDLLVVVYNHGRSPQGFRNLSCARWSQNFLQRRVRFAKAQSTWRQSRRFGECRSLNGKIQHAQNLTPYCSGSTATPTSPTSASSLLDADAHQEHETIQSTDQVDAHAAAHNQSLEGCRPRQP